MYIIESYYVISTKQLSCFSFKCRLSTFKLFPLSTWSWKDALKAVFLDRVNVVSEYNQVVRSPSIEFKLPSVVSLKDYIPLPEKAAFTRFNVFLRDKFICQYCTKTFKVEELTFDHVILAQKVEPQCGKM